MKIRSSKILYTVLSIVLISAIIINAVIVLAVTPSKTVTGSDVAVSSPKSATDTSEWNLDQLILDKKATDNEDGTYTLTIDAFVEGEAEWTPEVGEDPADIVLVIDQSSSMGYSISSGIAGIDTRQEAMQYAAKEFIESMAERYDESTSDHRIAIVTFGNEGTIKSGLLPVDNTNKTTLINTIDNLSIRSNVGTYTDEGMEKAQQILTTDYSYSGKNDSTRRKVVVLFTDGVPGSSGFSVTVANRAMSIADSLKNNGATIFTVGSFTDTDNSMIYPTATKHGSYTLDRYCTLGEVGESWSKTGGIFFGDIDQADIPAANRFLNAISSNYSIDNVGLKDDSSSFLFWETIRYTITQVLGKRSDEEHYYEAESAEKIAESFSGISEWIAHGGTTVKLTEKAVVKDIVSDYFNLPEGVTESDIKTYTSKCLGKDASGNYLWDKRVDTTSEESAFKGVSISITDYKEKNDQRNVSVTGFNFQDNYVTVDSVTGNARGTKLVIEFIITPIEGFSGGNNVPTNGSESGIYPDPTSPAVKVLPEPAVNVPIPESDDEIDATSLVIYKGNSVSFNDIFYNGESRPILDDYVERIVKVDGEVVEGGIFTPEHTVDYSEHIVSVTVKPRFNPESSSEGEGVDMKGKTSYNKNKFSVNVLEPTVDIELNDVQRFYGNKTEYKLGDDVKPDVKVTWAEPKEYATDEEHPKTEKDISTGIETVFAPFTASNILMDYSSTEFSGGVVGKKDFKVNAEAVFDKTVYTEELKTDDDVIKVSEKATVKYTTTCEYGCKTPVTDGSYKVHVKTCSLIIKNDGGAADEIFVYKIKKDGSDYTTVAVKGNSSETLNELPIGTYKAVLVSDWSWRYNSAFDSGVDSATLSSAKTGDRIICKHTLQKTNWYSSISKIVSNIFGKGESK